MKLFEEIFEEDPAPAEVPDDTLVNDKDFHVKYTDGTKYEVKANACLMWAKTHINKAHADWRGSLVDSQVIHTYYKTKWAAADRTKPRNQTGLATVGLNVTKEQGSFWHKNGLIWVVSTDGRVYSHIPKINRFHHSSFLSGGMVKSAGMWQVEQGRIIEMAPLSGHYKPTLPQFMAGVASLRTAVLSSRPALFLHFNPLGCFKTVRYDEWSKLSWEKLRESYKTHPQETTRPQSASLTQSSSGLAYSQYSLSFPYSQYSKLGGAQ